MSFEKKTYGSPTLIMLLVCDLGKSE